MDKLSQRISYLKGMMEGIDVSVQTREGKILREMAQLMEDMAFSLRRIKRHVDEQDEYIEAIDEDLNDLELLIYDDDDELELYDEEDMDDMYDGDYDQDVFDVDDDIITLTLYTDDENESGYHEVECPNCQEYIIIQ